MEAIITRDEAFSVFQNLEYEDKLWFFDKLKTFWKNLSKSKTEEHTEILYGKNHIDLLSDLSDFQEYKIGWDGQDALPLEKDTLKNFKKMLKNTDDDLLEGWHIEPKVNGTLVLVANVGNAVINIGNSTMSYFVEINGKISGSDPIPFSVEKTIEVLKRWKNC